MKFFEEIVIKYERKIPRKTEDTTEAYIEWTDYNYPSFYPIIHYKPSEVQEKEKQDFVSVNLLESLLGSYSHNHFLHRFFLRCYFHFS